MDTILDMTKVFLYYIYFSLLLTDVAWDNIFLFCSCRVTSLAYVFGKMAPVTAKIDAISLWFSTMDNALLHESGHSLAYKIEERITFALSHACLYLSESDDKRDDKPDAANTFDIPCGG